MDNVRLKIPNEIPQPSNRSEVNFSSAYEKGKLGAGRYLAQWIISACNHELEVIASVRAVLKFTSQDAWCIDDQNSH